ncbi:MAG: hypothetical protein AAF614_08295 [Chloroflexota bacterium]
MDKQIKIGLLIGAEKDWPDAFTAVLQQKQPTWQVKMLQLGFIDTNAPCSYDVIVDRMSHHVPFYRAYLKHAALQGCYIVNNPFVWGIDSKLFAGTLVDQLGWAQPRTVALPNKYVEGVHTADGFRNLLYPLDWHKLIDEIGLPAILKETRSGGRRITHRVHNLQELLNLYDDSGVLTMVLQQLIESDQHIHCLVVGDNQTHLFGYAHDEGKYLPTLAGISDTDQQQMRNMAQTITKTFGYDVNLVDFVLADDTIYITGTTNPFPIIDKEMMNDAQFDWCVQEMANMVIDRVQNPKPQKSPLAYAVSR